MKNRWFLSALFALTLCACIAPARAAVVSGGTEYLWGRAESGNVMISADRGCTYAELPGLAEEAARTGLSYDVALYPLEDGGIRVEGRDRWSTERSYQRDYSGPQVAQLLGASQPTPKKVLCTNGEMTVAVGYVDDRTNGDWTIANQYGWAQSNNYVGFFYSTDGVTWTAAEQEITASVEDGWWDGTAFHAGYFTSADGIHWTYGEEYQESPELALSTDLGPYHFEYDQGTGEVYLMDRTAADTGVLLPHMGEAIRASMEPLIPENKRAGSVRAWYGPNDTVYLAVYGIVGEESLALIDYPISSLDWCLENLKTQFRTIEPVASNGDMALGTVEWDFRLGWRGWTESRLAYNDGSGWRWAEDLPSGKAAEPICCEGGYFWVQGEGHHLYRSGDGHTWLLADALRPTDQESGSETYLKYQIAGTENGFIVGRHGGVSQHGMMGMSGGNWYEGYSKVYFLDKDFQLTGSYDFGRLVEAVGCLDGVYYAEVANSEGGRSGWASYDENGNEREPKVFNSSLGSTLYRSTDGKNWTAMPDIYTELDDMMASSVSIGDRQGHFPTGDPAKPQRSIARAGGFSFILEDDLESFYKNGEIEPYLEQWGTWVYLRGKNANLRLRLPEMNQGILDHWITPGDLSAEVLPDGGIKVTVTDYSTPSMTFSYTYTAEDLWERMAVEGNFYVKTYGWEICKPGVADLCLNFLPLGEKELLYRNEQTDGYQWYDSVPWSNSIDLLPFSGKDFMVYDPVDDKLWLSGDGLTWREVGGDFLAQSDGYQKRTYGLIWTGKNYLACCYLDNGKSGDEKRVSGEVSKVFLLDEELNVIFSHDFGRGLERVGYREGVFYAEVGSESWDERGRYGVISINGQAPVNILWRSADGVHWEETDILTVRECLRGLQ